MAAASPEGRGAGNLHAHAPRPPFGRDAEPRQGRGRNESKEMERKEVERGAETMAVPLAKRGAARNDMETEMKKPTVAYGTQQVEHGDQGLGATRTCVRT